MNFDGNNLKEKTLRHFSWYSFLHLYSFEIDSNRIDFQCSRWNADLNHDFTHSFLFLSCAFINFSMRSFSRYNQRTYCAARYIPWHCSMFLCGCLLLSLCVFLLLLLAHFVVAVVVNRFSLFCSLSTHKRNLFQSFTYCTLNLFISYARLWETLLIRYSQRVRESSTHSNHSTKGMGWKLENFINWTEEEKKDRKLLLFFAFAFFCSVFLFTIFRCRKISVQNELFAITDRRISRFGLTSMGH